MSFRVVYTKAFNGYRRDLRSAGHKKVASAINAAIVEASTSGEITEISRTLHGESRLPDVEKYDLGDGFRLVVQLVDGKTKTRAFLFAGTHDDAQRWLDNHRNYRWVQNKTDGVLEFVQVTYTEPLRLPADRADLEATKDYLDLPLLRDVADEDWSALRFPAAAIALARSVTGHLYEQDADGLLEKMMGLAGYDLASVFFDLLHHAANKAWRTLRSRIDFEIGRAVVVAGAALTAAMSHPANGDEVVTFGDESDLERLLEKGNIAEWMLFLHPQQRRVAERAFSGPARLRGASGSGKTAVLVHRARYLAKKYPGRVLVVTLTESMRKLLDQLCDDLCGLERTRIDTLTMAGLVRQLYVRLPPASSRAWTNLGQGHVDALLQHATDAMAAAPEFVGSRLASLEGHALRDFMYGELEYVRGRLSDEDLGSYVDTHRFHRRGQAFPLDASARAAVLVGMRAYVAELERLGVRDYEGHVMDVLARLRAGAVYDAYRCVLADEVQDLSQLELGILAALRAGSEGAAAMAPDGLFLAGDGAQTIYRRGFSLRAAGIDVSGRSLILQKSYRNTAEILRAAFALVERYEFADDDEMAVARPAPPALARRHGPRPTLLRCETLAAEVDAICRMTRSLLENGTAGGQICVISPSRLVREAVQSALADHQIEVVELKSDVDYLSTKVKVSTIESAKGHEFGSVFIAGLVQGLVTAGQDEREASREAARLYVAMTRARERLCLSYAPSVRQPPLALLEVVQPYCGEAVLRGGEIRVIRSEP